ncbi:DUF4387 family protein [Alphaproteobacteria bacterium KMM 3653]|uniref:DUF4387 family protein n=1 Tax=Harenicola maris TaxID=2841044 RepID=A0AAP2CSI1_9RHOB|nr:DUF4387 family protein [Harenicola maris]
MPKLRDIAQKVRSKNAGPFWLTIDIFCGTPEAYGQITSALSDTQVAATFGTSAQNIKRFELPDLNVVKISLPRPTVQGSIQDRDMHGASWAALLGEITL